MFAVLTKTQSCTNVINTSALIFLTFYNCGLLLDKILHKAILLSTKCEVHTRGITPGPIFKKPIMGLRNKFKLRIAGVPIEHLFLLDAWFKRKQMFGWHSCDSQLGSNPQAQDWFFKYGSWNFKLMSFFFSPEI